MYCEFSESYLFSGDSKANSWEHAGTSKYDSGRTMGFAVLLSDWTTGGMANRRYRRLILRRVPLIYLSGLGRPLRRHCLCYRSNNTVFHYLNRRNDGVIMMAYA